MFEKVSVKLFVDWEKNMKFNVYICQKYANFEPNLAGFQNSTIIQPDSAEFQNSTRFEEFLFSRIGTNKFYNRSSNSTRKVEFYQKKSPCI